MTYKNFIHHYLCDTLVATVLLVKTVEKILLLGENNRWSIMLTLVLATLAILATQWFYWFVVRRICIRMMLSGYKTFDRNVIRHIERKGAERWLSRYKKQLEHDKVYNGIDEKLQTELMSFAAEIYKAKKLREQEMKIEKEKKFAKVMHYTQQTLLLLNFSAEDVFKICNYVEFFVTTRSVIKAPASIAKHEGVSISELKNFVANIADQYDIDNTTAAQFVAEVFKDWCIWTDPQGKTQRTEIATIAKTLRTTKRKLRILPTTSL